MSRLLLNNQTYQDVVDKLKDTVIVTPTLLEEKKIMSHNCAIRRFNDGFIKGEKHGKRTYVFYKDSVLEDIYKTYAKKNEIYESKQQKIQKEAVQLTIDSIIERDHNMLVDLLSKFVKDVKKLGIQL